MDRLDSVEESVSQIIGKPVRFVRPAIAPEQLEVELGIVKTCYVDARGISCDSCEFVEACPTHFLGDLKYCICTQTLSDSKAYEKYIAKNQEILPQLKKAVVKKPKLSKRKMPSARD
jgi:hypothetical protein